MIDKNIKNKFILAVLFIISTGCTEPQKIINSTATPVISASANIIATPSLTPSVTQTVAPTSTPQVSATPAPSVTPSPVQTNISTEEQSNLKIKAIIDLRCSKCHSAAKLGGYSFNTLNDIVSAKSAIKGVVKSGRMPSGNVTNMTQEERNAVDSW